MYQTKRAVILINVGTPDNPDIKSVRKYLFRFLNDRRVIDLPWLLQKILVNMIIVPFRAKKSTLLYKTLWTENGSPLLFYMNSLVVKLQAKGSPGFMVYGAMRYGNPSVVNVLDEIKDKKYDEIIILPLYPQYASSTTGSVSELVMSVIQKWNVIPSVRFINQFYSHPAFIDSFVSRIKEYHPDQYDHIIFSYHGLPVRHINKIHPETNFHQCTCHIQLPEHGNHCYRAACYETTRLLACKAGLSDNTFTTSFQSRMSKNWLMPFTDKTIAELAGKGVKKILVIAPSFVADCLETSVEISDSYNKLFKQHGGEKLILVESLNDCDEWVDGLVKIIK